MKLFCSEKRKDPQKILEGVKAAYGSPNPAKTHGFEGTFLFSLGDVYVSDRLWSFACHDPDLKEFINECITRFHREDYGDISPSDAHENGESRYLGCGVYMFARYPYESECLKMRTYVGLTYICLDSEFDLRLDTLEEQR